MVAYEYDTATRRLVRVKNNGAIFAQSFTYGDTGALASYLTGGVTHTFTYDTRDRVQRLTAVGAGSQGRDLTYTYNHASEVGSITDARAGYSQSFTYDAVGRLRTGTGPWGVSIWSYDAAGNRRLTEGAGAGEMWALVWTDVDLEKGQLRVERNEWQGHICTTKGGRLRYVPMTNRLRQALREHRHLRGQRVLYRPDGQPMTESALKEAVLRAARRASLQCTGPHMLRHTFCSHLAMRGAAPRAIQELAGHRDLGTTQRYMHLSPAAIQSAIRLLDQPAATTEFGDILETGSVAIDKVNG